MIYKEWDLPKGQFSDNGLLSTDEYELALPVSYSSDVFQNLRGDLVSS